MALGVAPSTHARQTALPPAPLSRPVVVAPTSVTHFQQAVKQQQARAQWQQRQLEQQLRHDVSKNAGLPTADDPKTQQRLNYAEQVQLDRDRATQPNLKYRYRQPPVLPRVVPKPLPAPDLGKQDH